MNSIVKIGSIFAAAVIIIVSFASVVAYQSVRSTEKDSHSPLFSVRIQRAINKASERSMTSDYLGKGKTLYLFTSSQSMLHLQLDKALGIINNNPAMVEKLFERISNSPQVLRLLQQYGVSVADIELFLAQVKDNPELLKNQLNKVDCSVYMADGPQPLGLDTSSAIGCFITILVLLPIAIVIGIIIATITIVTCLNIGNCAETIIKAILTGMMQGLQQP